MITDKDIADYRTLCAGVTALREKFLERKENVRLLLQETSALRKDTLLVLAKANRLTRHLTGGQRQSAGISYHPADINARIKRVNQLSLVLFQNPAGTEEEKPLSIPENCLGKCRSIREIKQKEFVLLGVIKTLKNKLLELDLLELRCRELILSINKALEAFRCEFRIIRREIYPFGLFSIVYRNLRIIVGRTYFSLRDLEGIGALGNITANVLRITDSSVI